MMGSQKNSNHSAEYTLHAGEARREAAFSMLLGRKQRKCGLLPQKFYSMSQLHHAACEYVKSYSFSCFRK